MVVLEDYCRSFGFERIVIGYKKGYAEGFRNGFFKNVENKDIDQEALEAASRLCDYLINKHLELIDAISYGYSNEKLLEMFLWTNVEEIEDIRAGLFPSDILHSRF